MAPATWTGIFREMPATATTDTGNNEDDVVLAQPNWPDRPCASRQGRGCACRRDRERFRQGSIQVDYTLLKSTANTGVVLTLICRCFLDSSFTAGTVMTS